MGNLRRASELAAQRKKRHVWRNVVTCIAAFVVFCTTYALILPAITLETQELSCGLPEHTHSAACYRLVCGRQEVYSHTHTRENCYDASGALTCTLREQIAHHHTQDCYSVPQPVCGQVEHAAHTHGETCYAGGALTCVLAETEGHVHTPECYPADFVAQLICGQQDLPEHRHTDECYALACGLDEHTHTDACAANHREFVDNLVPTGQTESPATETETTETTETTAAATEATGAAEATGVTETTAPEATGDASVTEAPATESPVTEAPATESPATEAPAAPETTQPEASTQPEETTLPDAAVATEAPTDPQPTTETPPQDEDIIEDEDTILEPPMLLGAADTAEDGTSTDSSPERMTDVAFSVGIVSRKKDANGNWVPGAVFDKNNGFEMNLQINFSFNVKQDENRVGYITDKNNIGERHGNEYVLDLGDITLDWSTLYGGTKFGQDNKGANAFEYWYTTDENGKAQLHIRFLGDYVKDADEHMTGYIQLSGWMSKDHADENGNIKDHIDGDVWLDVSGSEIDYKDNESLDGDLTISKQGTYDPASKRLTYTVWISTTNGTPGPIEILDTLTKNGIEISNFRLVSVKDAWNTPLGEGTYICNRGESTSENEEFKLTLPKLEKGNRYEITYEYTLKDAPSETTLVNNAVKGTSTPKDDGKKLEHDSSSTVNVPKEMPTEPSESTDPSETTDPPAGDLVFGKTGSWEKDNDRICWTIVVNDYNFVNIADMVLQDEMLSMRLPDSALTVTVKWNETPLTQEECDKHFEISGNTIKFKAVDENGELRTDGKNTNRYVIKYYTSAGDLGKWGSNSVTNTARMGEKEAPWTVTEDGGKVEKTTGVITLDEDGRYHINWTVTVTLASDGITLNENLVDDTQPVGSSGKHYFDQKSVRLFYDGQALTSFQAKFYDSKDTKGEVRSDQDATYMEVSLTSNPTNDDSSVAGKQLILQYTTYAKREDMTGTGNWQNKVDYRGKTDISDANVTPPSIVKYDGRGIAGESSVENFNGELDWKIHATLGSVSNTPYLKIVDTLPQNVHVLRLSMEAITPVLGVTKAELLVDDSGKITGGDGHYSYSGVYDQTSGTVTVTATRQNGTDPLELGTAFVLLLNCKVDESFTEGSGAFKNHAEGETKEGSIGSSDQTQNWTKLEENPLDGAMSKTYLGKKGEQDRTLSYRVEINPKGVDIQPGSSKVYLTDEFSYQPGDLDLVFNLLYNSVKLYYATPGENGALVQGDPVNSNDWRWVVDEDNPKGFDYAKVTKYIRLEVPDATPLILEYKYVLSSFKKTQDYAHLKVLNKIYFTAYPDEKEYESNEDVIFSGLLNEAGIYTGQSLEITKLKEGNSEIRIPGAEFQLWKAAKNADGSWTWDGPLAMDGENPKKYVTDSDGELKVKYTEAFEYNVLYKLEETKAPDGYILSRNPPAVKFYFRNKDAEDKLPPEYSAIRQGAKDLSSSNDYKTITNTASTAEFSVEKIWWDSNGKIVTGNQNPVRLKLMRVGTEVRQDATVSDPLLSTAIVQICYGVNGMEKTEPLTVPKGAVVTVTVQNYLAGNENTAKLWIPGQGNYDNWYRPIEPEYANGTTRVYSFTVTHNIAFGVKAGDWSTAPIVTYSHTAQSTGSGETGETTPLVTGPEPFDTIILSAENGWRWHSVTNLKPVPIQDTVINSDGNPRTIWYSYYVVEDPSVDYTTFYSNMTEDGKPIGISSGTITVTNQLPPESAYTSVTVKKEWTDNDAGGYTSIPFKLIRKEWSTEPTGLETPALNYDDPLPSECTLVGEYALTKEKDWQWSSGNTLLQAYNGKWYTYFIIEQPGDYTTVYSPEVTDSTITVTNTLTKKPATIQVEKQWCNYQEKEITTNRTGSVSFELHQVATAEGQQPVDTLLGTYTLSNTTTPKTWHWDSETAGLGLLAEEWKVPPEGGEKVKVTYTYYVVEKTEGNATEKFTVEYKYGDGEFVESNTTGVSSGTIIIKNTLPSPEYELPATGGAGTLAYTLAGLTLTLTAALTLTATTRRKRPH